MTSDLCMVLFISVPISIKTSKQTAQAFFLPRNKRWFVKRANDCFSRCILVQKGDLLPKIIEEIFEVPLIHPDFKNIKQGCIKTQKHGCKHIEEHALLYKGDISQLNEKTDVLIRLNSACFTGDIFGDRSCDCNWQLFEALRLIDNSSGTGLVIYHFEHEGKAHGYFEKLKSFDGKMYPVDGDLRNFLPAVAILLHLNIHRVRLITNNPEKQNVLVKNNIEVVEIVPVVSQDQSMLDFYDYKATTFGHALPRKTISEHQSAEIGESSDVHAC